MPRRRRALFRRRRRDRARHLFLRRRPSADGLDGGAKGAAAATKKVFLGPTPGATPGAAAPTLEALEARGSGGPPINYCVGRGEGAMGVESEGPPLKASSEIGAFPYHKKQLMMQLVM